MSHRLVILLHSYTKGPKDMAHVENVVRDAFGETTDVIAPKLPVSLGSRKDPDAIAAQVVRIIDDAWNSRRETESAYDHITLIGHSIGALIGRKAYVLACGENPETPFWDRSHRGSPPDSEFEHPREWAGRVDRVILLAGMNRGWALSHHLGFRRWILVGIASFFATVSNFGPWPSLTITRIRRGAPFITKLRLEWLAMRRHASVKGIGNALVVQLLGTVDDMVSPEDNIDLVAGADFVYLDVPRSGHASIREMDASVKGRARAAVLRLALVEPAEALKFASSLPSDVLPRLPDPEVNNVVFVIHGIRDKGYWTQRVARKVLQAARSGQVFATETSSYGYFPMLPFLLPWRRRRKVEWFMDQYAECRALYPNAQNDFHFVGHSNGTYLLARALQDYPACRFNRVVFAGSVVRRRYNWSRAVANHQVKQVLNYVATSDCVVASVPKGLQWLRIFDIGSAGHDGFIDRTSGSVEDVKLVKGRHDAAIKEDHWNAIAAFISEGRLPDRNAFAKNRRFLLTSVLGWTSSLLVLMVLIGLVLGIVCILKSNMAEPYPTLLALGVIGILWLVATRL